MVAKIYLTTKLLALISATFQNKALIALVDTPIYPCNLNINKNAPLRLVVADEAKLAIVIIHSLFFLSFFFLRLLRGNSRG